MAGTAPEYHKQAAQECFELEKEYRVDIWKAIKPLDHPTRHFPPVFRAMAKGEQRTRPSVARLPALLGECFDSVGEDTQPRLREALRVKPSLVAESLEESLDIG